MGKPAQVAQDDASSNYESRIQKLVEEDRVDGARRLVGEALRTSPADPTLLKWKEVLAPGRVSRAICIFHRSGSIARLICSTTPSGMCAMC